MGSTSAENVIFSSSSGSLALLFHELHGALYPVLYGSVSAQAVAVAAGLSHFQNGRHACFVQRFLKAGPMGGIHQGIVGTAADKRGR